MPKKSNPQNPEDSKKWENPNKIDDEEMDIYDDPEDNLNINEIIEGKRNGTIKKKEDEEYKKANEEIDAYWAEENKRLSDKEKLTALYMAYSPVDADQRVELLEQSGDGYISYMTWCQMQMNDILMELFGYEGDSNDERISQFFVIDGVRGDQLWADKYKSIESRGKRERLYRTEIIKVMLQGEKDIKLRFHQKNSAGKAVEVGLVTLLPSRKNVEKMIDSIALYKLHAQRLLRLCTRLIHDTNEKCGNRADGQNQTFIDMTLTGYSLANVIRGTITSKDTYNSFKTEYDDYLSFEIYNGDDNSKGKGKGKGKVEGIKPNEFNTPISMIPESINELIRRLAIYIGDNQEAEPEGVKVAQEFKKKLAEELLIMQSITKDITGDVLFNKDGKTLNQATLFDIEEKVNQFKGIYEKYSDLNVKTQNELEQELNDRTDKVQNNITDKIKKNTVFTKLKNRTKMTADEVKALDAYLPVRAECNKINSASKKDNNYVKPTDKARLNRLQNAMSNCGLVNKRESSVSSVFRLWAMGYKGISISDLSTLTDNDKKGVLLDEFMTFCEQNPVADKNAKPDEVRTYIRNWAQIIKKATYRFLDYKIPDIDYNDKNALDRYKNELFIMKNLSVDFIQEFVERIGQRIIPGGTGNDGNEYRPGYANDYIAEAFGGSDKYRNAQNAIRNAQSLADAFDRAYVPKFRDEYWDQGKPGPIIDDLSGVALQQSLFKKAVNGLKGKKLGEIPARNSNRIQLYRKVAGDLYSDILGGLERLDANRVLNYLEGKDTQQFDDYLESTFLSNEVSKEMRNNKSAYNARGYDTNIIKPELAHLLLSTDSIEGFRNILKGKTEFSSNADTVRTITRDLFELEFGNILSQMNLSFTDVIKVDGKTPDELWGEKYAQADNSYEKEMFYRIELIKTALIGDKEIRLDGIVLDNNFEYKMEGKSYIASPKRADVERFVTYSDYLNRILTNMDRELETYQRELQGVQRNRNANFTSGQREGSQEYQNMCKALVALRNFLQNEPKHHTLSELRRKVANFEKESRAYYKRGKTSNQQKLVTANAAYLKFSGYLGVIDDISKVFDKDIPVFEEGKFMRNGQIEHIEWAIKKFNNNLKHHTPIPELNENTQRSNLEELIELRKNQSTYMNIADSYIGKYPDPRQHMSAEGVAKLVVRQQCIDYIYATEMTSDRVQHEDVIHLKDDLKTRIKNLKNNKVFKVIAERFQAETPKKWKQILERAQVLNAEYTRDVNKYSGATAIKYIYEDKAFTLKAAKNYRREDKYDKLGEIIAKQILIRPESRELLQGLAAEQFELADLKKACADYIREKGVLERGSRDYISDENLSVALENGELRNQVLSKVSEPLKRVVEQRARQHAENHQERAPQNMRP